MADAHPYGRWNFTNRGSESVYNHMFQGRQNKAVAGEGHTAKSNQGYHNLISKFPQGAMGSCRYPLGVDCNRSIQMNNWNDKLHEWEPSAGVKSMSMKREVVQEVLPVVKPRSTVRPPKQHRQKDIENYDRHYETMLKPGQMYRPSKNSQFFLSQKQAEEDALSEHVRAVSR